MKLLFTLLYIPFINAMIKIMGLGLSKYEHETWKNRPKSKLKDAIYRHYSEYLLGNKIDDESGISHLAHIACNCMILYYLEQQTDYDEQKDKDYYNVQSSSKTV